MVINNECVTETNDIKIFNTYLSVHIFFVYVLSLIFFKLNDSLSSILLCPLGIIVVFINHSKATPS